MSTLYGACRENKMSHLGDKDRNVDRVLAVVYGQLLLLRRSDDAVRTGTQLLFIADPTESDWGSLDQQRSLGSAS